MKINFQTIKIIYFFSILIFILSCQKEKKTTAITFNSDIENYINEVIIEKGIPGVALAIIKNDSIIFRKNFGKASIEHDVAISDQSIFRVYSLTKPVISVAVFQLIEQNKLSLEDELSKHFDSLPNTWNSIKIKHLLTHSSGLPDIVNFSRDEETKEPEAKARVFKEKNEFEKGERYKYNQTNFWLLHRLIEKLSGQTLGDFIADNQFEGERKNVFFSSDSKEIIKNRVTPYFPFATGKMRIDHSTILGDYMFAANGLNITLEEYIKWNKRLKNNELIKKDTKKQMWQAFEYSNSDKIFTNGWDKIILHNHNSYGFTGSLITAYRVFPEDDMSIILLSNGLGKIYDIDEIVNELANKVDEDIYDVEEVFFDAYYSIMIENDFDTFKKRYIKNKNNSEFNGTNYEGILNGVGYQLLRNNHSEKAIQIFKFNTEENPTSINTFDSLGEAYFTTKNYDLSQKYYQIAFDLGDINGNAKMMLEKINALK